MKQFLREFDENIGQYVPQGTRQLFFAHLIGVFALMFFQLFGNFLPVLGEIGRRIFLLDPQQAILQGHLWQFFTYQFAYTMSFSMIIFAAIYLLVFLSFCTMFETQYEARQLWTFVVLCGLVGGIFYALIGLTVGLGGVTAMGSLGSLIGLLLFMTLLYPRMEVRLFFIIPIQLRFVTAIVMLLLVLDFGGSLSAGGAAGALHHTLSIGGIVTALAVWRRPQLLDLSDRLPYFRRSRKKARIVRMGNMGHPGRHSDPDDRYNDPHWRLDQ